MDIVNLVRASPFDDIPGNFTFYLAARTMGNVFQYKPIILSHNIQKLYKVFKTDKKNETLDLTKEELGVIKSQIESIREDGLMSIILQRPLELRKG